MSTPQGPRARSNSRGRGTARGGLKSRDPRLGGLKSRDPRLGGAEKQASQRGSYNATRGGDLRHLKPPQPDHHRNHSWTKKPLSHDPLNSAIQSHTGKIQDPRLESWRDAATVDSRTYRPRMDDLYQTLKQNRERERRKAIKDGFLADPDKPTSLANAITLIGTCQDMCPEYERIERIVQRMVDGVEKMPSKPDADIKVPCEELMVKRFRRSAAGYDEQLPSDIRPPLVLQKTLNYLFNHVVGGPQPLATVHKFVWDRTRSVRNDFSIQQVSRIEDLKIAIDCFERIARFHILSLHQLSQLQAQNGEFDAHQEREQLNNTLLSLMYYYDDSRHKFTSPNEAEFRAYCIIFEIQDQRPDLEDRAQNWPRSILKDPRVQIAFKLYAAAGNTADEQGPLRPRTKYLTAQANTGGFWDLVQSNAVSYLMACVAEIYFNLVRRTALEAIWKAYKGKRGGPTKMEDWTMSDLTLALGFDTEDQAQAFCEEHEFEVSENENGDAFLDLGSVMSGNLTDQNARRKQIFSQHLVEDKRLGRTLPAVINGLTASQAQAQGFVQDLSEDESTSIAHSESLFVNGSSDDEGKQPRSRSESPTMKAINGDSAKPRPTATTFNPFGPSAPSNSAKTNPFHASTTFGQPSSASSSNPSQGTSTPTFEFGAKPAPSIFSDALPSTAPPKFDFYPSEKTTKVQIFPSLQKAEGTNNSLKGSPFGSPVEVKESAFSQPSSTFPSTSASEPAKTTLSSPSTLPGTTASSQAKSAFDQSSKSSNLPKFSFATSPLFGFPTTKLSEENSRVPTLDLSQGSEASAISYPSTQKSDARANPTLFSTKPTSSETTSTLFPPPKEPIESPSVSKAVPKPFSSFLPSVDIKKTLSASTTAPPVISKTPLSFSPFSATKHADFSSQPNVQSEPLKSPSFAANPPTVTEPQQQPPGLFPSNILTLSGSTAVDSTHIQSQEGPFDSSSSQVDLLSAALDKLSNSMMVDDHGILQQFIEYTVGPIITCSVAQLEDESSWEEARECRAILLSKKYFKRWRINAWNIGLMRKGRERRRNFAKSVQDSARNSPKRQTDLSFSLTESPANLMPPPPGISRKRQSLPADLGHQGGAIGSKRKRDDSMLSAHEILPRPTKVYHRRSQTLGNSMSAPPHRLSRSLPKSRVDISKVPEGSMLHDTLMKQARRLAPNAKSDTTRTDYFRLKALGIDPDTPVVPLTEKRTRREADLADASEAGNSFPQRTSSSPTTGRPKRNPQTPSKPSSSVEDDDGLFAQIRSIREALAESEHWMHSERQMIERSMTPQTGNSLPANETPAQRRLREIKERGHTPSRSEIRLRAMGDRALLPKGFWDGQGMGTSLFGKGKGRGEVSPPTASPFIQSRPPEGPPMMGFAALGMQGRMNGVFGAPGQMNSHMDVHMRGESPSEEAQPKKGASMEDAIEL